jgi:hypothetical protein
MLLVEAVSKPKDVVKIPASYPLVGTFYARGFYVNLAYKTILKIYIRDVLACFIKL